MSELKKCNSCKRVKRDCDFYASNRTKCKECVKKAVRENRRDNIDYYLEYDRKRASNPDRVEARAAYAKTRRGQKAHAKANRKWNDSNKKKKLASNTVNNAVRDGRLIKSDFCESCGKNGLIHGHHDDYSKPLAVRWLCPQCHWDWHKENGEGKNAD